MTIDAQHDAPESGVRLVDALESDGFSSLFVARPVVLYVSARVGADEPHGFARNVAALELEHAVTDRVKFDGSRTDQREALSSFLRARGRDMLEHAVREVVLRLMPETF